MAATWRNTQHNGLNGSSSATPLSIASNSESTPPAARGWRSTATQVLATRSLSELAAAINAVRGNFAAVARSSRNASTSLSPRLEAHNAELLRSPGRTWLELEKQDFTQAVKLRVAIEKFDSTANDAARREFLEESSALTAGVQQQLQEPARRGLMDAAARAAATAEIAEHTLTKTGIAVLGVVLIVSVLVGRRASACPCGA